MDGTLGLGLVSGQGQDVPNTDLPRSMSDYGFDCLDHVIGFQRNGASSDGTEHGMSFDAVYAAEYFQQMDAVDCARRSRDSDDDTFQVAMSPGWFHCKNVTSTPSESRS